MGSSKKEQYTQNQLDLAKTAKAIGHPARIVIIQFLSVHSVGNYRLFMEQTKLSSTTICFHLKELVDAGLVTDRFFHKDHYFFLTPNAKSLVAQLDQILS